jgi:uncharacterized protein
MPANFHWTKSTPLKFKNTDRALETLYDTVDGFTVPGPRVVTVWRKSSDIAWIRPDDDADWMISDDDVDDFDDDDVNFYKQFENFMNVALSDFSWKEKINRNDWLPLNRNQLFTLIKKSYTESPLVQGVSSSSQATQNLSTKWKLQFSGDSEDGCSPYRWSEDLLTQIDPMENYCIINVSTPNNDGFPAYFHVYLKDNLGPVMVYEFDINSLTDTDYSANFKLISSLFENIHEPGVYLSEYLASGRVNQLDLFMKDFSDLGLECLDGFSFKPMRGKFVIYKDNAGEFRFRLSTGDGQIILTSESYKTKARCITGIESVRKNSQTDDCFGRKDTESGKWMFNLKASNGRVIGTSEIYESEKARESGIASVINNAAKAKLDDQVAYD